MSDKIPKIRAMMMPKHTNPHGIIFGGVLLSYIDQAGAIAAREHAVAVAATRIRGAKKTIGSPLPPSHMVMDVKFVTVAMNGTPRHRPTVPMFF